MIKSIFITSLAVICMASAAEARPTWKGGSQIAPGLTFTTYDRQQPSPGGGHDFKEGDMCMVTKGKNLGKVGTINRWGKCVGTWGEEKCINNGSDNGQCKVLADDESGSLPSYSGRHFDRAWSSRFSQRFSATPSTPAPSAPTFSQPRRGAFSGHTAYRAGQ